MLFLRSQRHTFPRISTPRGGGCEVPCAGDTRYGAGDTKYGAGTQDKVLVTPYKLLGTPDRELGTPDMVLETPDLEFGKDLFLLFYNHNHIKKF